jgi:hypothetical protein
MTVNSGRHWTPGQPVKPECRGCGHKPHRSIKCEATTFITRRRCACPYDDRQCSVRGCAHRHDAHVNVPGVAYCRTCFDIYPSDDSAVDGGVYHPFNGEKEEVRTVNEYASDHRD